LQADAKEASAHIKMGKVYLFTGSGAGKTTNALGLALRSIGHDHNVIMIQFMKYWEGTGEFKAQKKLKGYKVYQYGRPGWLKISGGKAKFGKQKFKTRRIEPSDRKYALEGLKKAEMIMDKEKPDLLILDEINLAVHAGLLETEEVLSLLDKIPKETTIVMTGRKAHKALISRADYVDIITATKRPKISKTTKGIQY